VITASRESWDSEPTPALDGTTVPVLGHFHQNINRNQQKPPQTHSIFILEALQILVVSAALLQLFFDRFFSFGVLSTDYLILSDHYHLISLTPTPITALLILKASQLHHHLSFLLGLLVF
jgi:hypothetical protein